jgi:hypothetical protein
MARVVLARKSELSIRQLVMALAACGERDEQY